MPVELGGETVRAILPSALAEGSYVLGWRVISDDSHPESGVLSFSVGRADAALPAVIGTDTRPVDILYGVLTALGYLRLFCLVGLTVFDLLIARTAPTDRRLRWVTAIVAVSAYLLLVPLNAVRERGAGFGGLFVPAVIAEGWTGAAVLTLVLAACGAALMLFRVRLPRREGFWAGATGPRGLGSRCFRWCPSATREPSDRACW